MTRAQQGLTLVEMLVVILLVAMISTLLVQGLGNAMSLYQKVSTEQVSKYRESMSLAWFRRVITAAVPNPVDLQVFRGTQSSLTLASFQPLLDRSMVNAQVTWSISRDPPYSVEYAEGESRITLPLPLGERPTLSYLDASGRWWEHWPAGENSYYLPQSVRLNLGQKHIEVNIDSHRQPHFFADEIINGRD